MHKLENKGNAMNIKYTYMLFVYIKNVVDKTAKPRVSGDFKNI